MGRYADALVDFDRVIELDEAELRICDALAQACYPGDVGLPILDLPELHDAIGRDVTALIELIELLAGGSAGAEHFVHGDGG